MPNQVKGEASLNAGGRALLLRYDFDAFCEVEDLAGQSLGDIIEKMGGNPPLKVARAMLAGGLKRHHPELTLDDIGEILLADPQAASAAMQSAMMSAMGKPSAEGNVPGKPKAVRRGISTRSSKRGAKQG